MNTCCICLDEITSNTEKLLSCGHKLHVSCYMKYVFNTKVNFYVKCPMCREKNFNFTLPGKSLKDKLLNFLSPGVTRITCVAQTKNNMPCKNKSILFNYGYCQCHSPNILKSSHYSLFFEYLTYLFTSQMKNFKNKLYMIDMGKQFIIQNKQCKLLDILIMFRNYFETNQGKKDSSPTQFYKIHNLQLPPLSWINYCCEKKILF